MDETLLNIVSSLSQATLDDLADESVTTQYFQDVENMIYHWTGMNDVAPDDGPFSLQKIAALAKLTDTDLSQVDFEDDLRITSLESSWNLTVNQFFVKILFQNGALDHLKLTYDPISDSMNEGDFPDFKIDANGFTSGTD